MEFKMLSNLRLKLLTIGALLLSVQSTSFAKNKQPKWIPLVHVSGAAKIGLYQGKNKKFDCYEYKTTISNKGKLDSSNAFDQEITSPYNGYPFELLASEFPSFLPTKLSTFVSLGDSIEDDDISSVSLLYKDGIGLIKNNKVKDKDNLAVTLNASSFNIYSHERYQISKTTPLKPGVVIIFLGKCIETN